MSPIMKKSSMSTSSSLSNLKRTDSGVCFEEASSDVHSLPTSIDNFEDSRSCFQRFKWIIFRLLAYVTSTPLSKWITWTFFLLLVYGSSWAFVPEKMAPNQPMFSLLVTIILCFLAEQLVAKIPTPEGYPPVPSLLASLLTGLALFNLPSPCNIAVYIEPETSKKLRELSLTVILTAAGLEIDPEAMKKVKFAIVRLAFIPCVFETATYSVLIWLLLDFPFTWSLMTGFMLSAVSPAVVVPALILVQQKGLGTAKGIPSLVMAASGIDDVLAIAGFTVLLGINIPEGIEKDILVPDYSSTITPNVNGTSSDFNIGKEIGGALLEVVIGAVVGLVCGIILGNFPSKNMKYKNFLRGSILLMNGVLWVFGTEIWGIEGAGAISALLMSFVAAYIWKEERLPLAHGWENIWKVFQPILFGLTGAMVDLKTFKGDIVGYGLICIVSALAVRMLVAAAVMLWMGFKKKEKLFVAVSWVPKGTVQAALGSVALDLALKELPINEDHKLWGEEILMLAVLATLLTAPIGAVAISMCAPRLLNCDSSSTSAPSGAHDNEAFESDADSVIGKKKLDEIEIKNEGKKDVKELVIEDFHKTAL